MTDTTTDQPTKEFTELPVELIDPDPHNRKAVADKDFVASVVQHGVLEAVLKMLPGWGGWRFLFRVEGLTLESWDLTRLHQLKHGVPRTVI